MRLLRAYSRKPARDVSSISQEVNPVKHHLTPLQSDHLQWCHSFWLRAWPAWKELQHPASSGHLGGSVGRRAGAGIWTRRTSFSPHSFGLGEGRPWALDGPRSRWLPEKPIKESSGLLPSYPCRCYS